MHLYIYSSRNEGLVVWWRIGLANGMGERVWRQTKFQTFLLTTLYFSRTSYDFFVLLPRLLLIKTKKQKIFSHAYTNAFMVPLWLVGLFCCCLPKKGQVYITFKKKKKTLPNPSKVKFVPYFFFFFIITKIWLINAIFLPITITMCIYNINRN